MASEDPTVSDALANTSVTDNPKPEQPRTDAQLERITKDACNTTLSAATSYIHSETESWNTSIINSILQGLLPQPNEETTRPSYKFAVNSTIIQHLSDPPTTSVTTTTSSSSTGTTTDPTSDALSPSHPDDSSTAKANGSPNGLDGAGNGGGNASSAPARGRRGMHSATGAFWNNETDGMFSYKWEGGEKKGMDVVVSIIWIHTGAGVVED